MMLDRHCDKFMAVPVKRYADDDEDDQNNKNILALNLFAQYMENYNATKSKRLYNAHLY